MVHFLCIRIFLPDPKIGCSGSPGFCWEQAYCFLIGPELLSFGETMHDVAADAELLREGQHLFQLRSLSFSYADGHCALQDIDLDINTGDKVALVGQNGAGKTTLFKHLNGIYTNQTGSLLYNGESIQDGNLIRVRR